MEAWQPPVAPQADDNDGGSEEASHSPGERVQASCVSLELMLETGNGQGGRRVAAALLLSSEPTRPTDNDNGERRGRTVRLWLVARMLPAPPRPVLIMGSLPREVERVLPVLLSSIVRCRLLLTGGVR